jgi:hypothetical protein
MFTKFLFGFLLLISINPLRAEEAKDGITDYALISKLANRTFILEDFSLPPSMVFYQNKKIDIFGYFKLIPDYKKQIEKKGGDEDFYSLAELDGKKITPSDLKNIRIYLVDEKGKKFPVKYSVDLKKTFRVCQREMFYRFVVSATSLPIGMYQLKFDISIPGHKNGIHLTNDESMPTNRIVVKEAKTENDRELAILMQLDSMDRKGDYLSLKTFVNDLLLNKRTTIRRHLFEVASYLSRLAAINGEKRRVLAWSLLFSRSDVIWIDINSRVHDYGGWENALKDEREIEKITSELKEKYFPDMEYKYPPEVLNLRGLYEDKKAFDLIVEMEKEGKSEKEIEAAVRKAFPGFYTRPRPKREHHEPPPPPKPDLVILLKADGTIIIDGKNVNAKDVPKILHRKKLNKNARVLVVGQEKCDISDVSSLLDEIRKLGIEENLVFKLEDEL